MGADRGLGRRTEESEIKKILRESKKRDGNMTSHCGNAVERQPESMKRERERERRGGRGCRMSDRAVSPQDGRENRNQRRTGEWTHVKWERAGWRGHKHIERASIKRRSTKHR
ncbi:hypothetical protein SRHO_G00020930 [Serrasalmus rhombeus]